MKSHRLERFVAPPPAPAPTCAACKAYRPEVVVPLGEGALELCWLCAHHHVDHGVALSECAEAQCEHTGAEIYPRLQIIVDDETRPLLECAKRAAAEVAAWPAWKRGDVGPQGQATLRAERNVAMHDELDPAWRRGRGPDKKPRVSRQKP